MPSRTVRLICSVCDRELPSRKAAHGEVADIQYVNQQHRGCNDKPPKKTTIVDSGRTMMPHEALDGTALAERPAPMV